MLKLWNKLVEAWRWLNDTSVDDVQPTPLAQPPVEHKMMSERIVAGRVIVINASSENVKLEGTVLRTLFLKAGDITTIQSPLLQPIWRVKNVVMDKPSGQGMPEVKAVDREILWINEWDGLEIVENMIEEYARARAYDIMTPGELQSATLPLSREALQPIIEKLGLKAQRENENISTEA